MHHALEPADSDSPQRLYRRPGYSVQKCGDINILSFSSAHRSLTPSLADYLLSATSCYYIVPHDMSPVNQPSARILFKAPTAERIASTEFDAFRRYVNRSQPASAQLRDYWEVHAWTLREPNAFWTKLWDYMGLVGEKASVVCCDSPGPK